jgi:hypothetical protein
VTSTVAMRFLFTAEARRHREKTNHVFLSVSAPLR